MLTVDISDLESDVKGELSDFIQSKLMVKSDGSGDTITFDDRSERTHVSSPEIRTYLKRFMHSKDLRKRYRLLSVDGSLKFVKLREDQIEDEGEEKKGSKKK